MLMTKPELALAFCSIVPLPLVSVPVAPLPAAVVIWPKRSPRSPIKAIVGAFACGLVAIVGTTSKMFEDTVVRSGGVLMVPLSDATNAHIAWFAAPAESG